jgi:lipoprotein-anchoring transpeptidase ErfK/SrfK
MQRHMITALVMGALGIASAHADPLSLRSDMANDVGQVPRTPAYIAPQIEPMAVAVRHEVPPAPVPYAEPAVRYAAAPAEPPAPARDVNLGGGLIEFLFSGGPFAAPRPPSEVMARAEPPEYSQQTQASAVSTPAREALDPKYLKQVVTYPGPEKPGTVIIDTPNRFLYLVQDNGTALRYGIGVGRDGFTWAGVKTISAKKEWPDWVPPPEMLQRQPSLPHFMAGGPDNPLGARAMYLGSSLYRIHGSNEPWTIGQAVSSGCIRMRNEDVVDLYDRVKLGTKVLVM